MTPRATNAPPFALSGKDISSATLLIGPQHEPDSEGYLGRRIEADGSWTMYHVFTGIPARIANCIMVGLSKAEATDLMVSRNGDCAIP